MPNIFISHSNEDSEATDFIVAALRRAGYGVWVDFENIRGGAEWLCEIEAGIERCDAVVLVLSAASRGSTWVERECLYAYQLRKPVITALIADVLIPLHLINIQYCDLRERRGGLAKLLEALAAIQLEAESSDYVPAAISRQPLEANFFPYMEQLPSGDVAGLVARDLYHWARQIADEVAFGGAVKPGFHARVNRGAGLVTIFSVWAYRRRPSAQIPLDLLAAHAPFSRRSARREVLRWLNRLLPKRSRIAADSCDRRPTFPLRHLSDAEKLEAFKRIVLDIAERLRQP
ncbi:MAG: toll/interleukin-1 receptor domain-containing protein [Anaerolineae bacterium]|nr:toll/interleukin-1 receptor domain-containing protein [Anaerolineae bacterium]